jgi:hypothetical protein
MSGGFGWACGLQRPAWRIAPGAISPRSTILKPALGLAQAIECNDDSRLSFRQIQISGFLLAE